MVIAIEAEVARFNKRVQDIAQNLTGPQFILFHKKIHLQALRGVVLKTPVNTGRLRGNWQTTIGIPAQGELERLSKNFGGLLNSEGLGKLALLGAFQITWLTNNLPYAEVVERGLYPNPPKFGSVVRTRRGKRRLKILSAGGFSKKAPRGMVAVTIAELRILFP